MTISYHEALLFFYSIHVKATSLCLNLLPMVWLADTWQNGGTLAHSAFLAVHHSGAPEQFHRVSHSSLPSFRLKTHHHDTNLLFSVMTHLATHNRPFGLFVWTVPLGHMLETEQLAESCNKSKSIYLYCFVNTLYVQGLGIYWTCIDWTVSFLLWNFLQSCSGSRIQAHLLVGQRSTSCAVCSERQ